MITPQRHAQVMELFNDAVELPAERRASFLDQACGSDRELRAEVEALLANDVPALVLDEPALAALTDLDDSARRPETAVASLPEHIGGFRILALLGVGGMGIVYRATQLSTGRTVALKLIRPGLSTAAAQRRFRIEIETLARLRHPGIVAIYEAGTTTTPLGDQPYIAMEYVEGTPLTSYVAEHSPDTRTRVEILTRICEAVEYAHQRGVIHRDLKPANVCVESSGGTPQPRILDFGVARLIDRAVGDTVVTAAGELVGTLAYMSPEQLDGDPHAVDTRSDVYSLGALGYELLCDHRPIEFPGSSVFAALRAIRETIPRPLATVRPALRGDLDTVVLKALAKDAERRYPSAAALGQDLRRYLDNQPILARKPSLPYLARKFAARHRVFVASATLISVLVVAGIAGTTYGLFQARQSAAQLRAQVRDTSETASYLVQEVVANLDTISGTAEVRQRMLERLKRQVDQLLAYMPNDPVLVKARATILSQRADLEFSAGHTDGALRLRQTALAILEALAAGEPGNGDRQADVSIALVKIGDVYKERREWDVARLWYERAFEIDQRLAADHPSSVRFLDNLAWSFDRLAECAIAQQRLDDATGFLRERVRTNERLLALEPDRLRLRFGIWEAQDLLATVACLQGNVAEDEQQSRAALETARQLARAQPNTRDYSLALAIACMRFDESAWANPREAITALDEALRLLRKLHSNDPQDTRTRMLLWLGLFGRGKLAWQTDDPATTLRMFEELLDLAREAGLELFPERPHRGTAEAKEYVAKARNRLATQPAGASAP